MVNKYTLSVKNSTGAPQNYSFFAANPIISDSDTGPVWSNILKTNNNTPNGATATFEVSHNYYAVCGSFEGDPAHGANTSISKSVGITLGTDSQSGSSVALSVMEGSYCDLGRPTHPGSGKIGNFQLTTSGGFTYRDAKNNNLMVGIATSRDGDMASTIASFIPTPNSNYQIQPPVIYYVCSGERFRVGDAVKVEQVRNTQAVNFDERQTNNITLTHNEQQRFIFN